MEPAEEVVVAASRGGLLTAPPIPLVSGLKAWLLAPLRELLTDDDALDGVRGAAAGALISEPVSAFTIPMKLEGSVCAAHRTEGCTACGRRRC